MNPVDATGHAVVVLGAGASTRLGQPKQLLRVEGETLLHRMVRLARGTAPTRLAVVLPADAPALIEALSGLACSVVTNPDPKRGMRSSLEAAAPGVHAFPHVLVIACDQPGLDAAHLHALLRGACNAASGCAATRLGDALGVPAVVPGHWFSELGDGDADSGFRARLRRLDASALYVLEAPALALDIDTPDALRIARAQGLIDR